MNLHTMPNFNDYFPQTQGSKIPFPSYKIPCDEFQPLFWNVLSAHENQEQLKKKGQITPTLQKKNWSQYILHYLPNTTAVETTVSLKTYHPMKPVKF
jgi:hypothetical protein